MTKRSDPLKPTKLDFKDLKPNQESTESTREKHGGGSKENDKRLVQKEGYTAAHRKTQGEQLFRKAKGVLNDETGSKADNITENHVPVTTLPKGFVTKGVMEAKIKNRNQNSGTASSSKYELGQSNKGEIAENKGLPQGFVTRSEMEHRSKSQNVQSETKARLTSRKTKTTKISPMYVKRESLKEPNEPQAELKPAFSEEMKKHMQRSDPAARKAFSILENKDLPIPSKGKGLRDKLSPGKDHEEGKKSPEVKTRNLHAKPPQPTSTEAKAHLLPSSKEMPKSKAAKQTEKPPFSNEMERRASVSTEISTNSLSIKNSNHSVATRNTSTAIPKRQTKTDSAGKMTLASVKILIMNANGKDDKGGSPTERRKNAIQNVVVKHMPHITLFQEFSWSGISGKTWAKYPLPDQYVYKGHYEASIMYDDTNVSVHDMPASDLDTILKGLQSSSNNRLKRTFPMDFAPMSRMCISRITALTKPTLDFICISWHGKSNERGGGRMKELKKIEYFEYWMEFLRNIREKYKLPILAAGDYNVDMYSIEKCVESPFKLCLYEASMRRTVRGIVDYCIVTEDLDFSEITWVNLERDTTVYHPNSILDHDPVVGMLNVSPLGATGAAMGFGKKKAWPSPIAKVK